MNVEIFDAPGRPFRVISVNTAVLGSGAAGLNAACMLDHYGQKNIAVFTEGLNFGTSRNTGSDKQTYYKLSLCGETKDSPREMAKALFSGGAMDGDIALAEAAGSAAGFYRLCALGVPFPKNRFGEYAGYRTDHDSLPRASSAGPLTSRLISEVLLTDAERRGIKIYQGFQALRVFTRNGEAAGFAALDLNAPDSPFVTVNCVNLVFATGGPAGLYEASVYPRSQTGATGIALEAGAEAKNLLEWQYGIASVGFRWNLSGTYQQALPRYISIDQDGVERDFLAEGFKNPEKLLNAVFLKGYQWPFDVNRIENGGSSLMDILVHEETVAKKRRVFLDFNSNPPQLMRDGRPDFSRLGSEARVYLENSGALKATPLDRLKAMNPQAYALYLDNGIDLAARRLEIAVCAQHNNGGLAGNIWWESSIRHLFPVGEVNGTHGIKRPGGSALNSGQVGSARAAEYIARHYNQEPPETGQFVKDIFEQFEEIRLLADRISARSGNSNTAQTRRRIQSRMTRCAAHIRSLPELEKALEETAEDLAGFAENTVAAGLSELAAAFQNRDLLIAQIAYINSMADYIRGGGESRGSCLVQKQNGKFRAGSLSYNLAEDAPGLVQISALRNGKPVCRRRPPEPIPEEDCWFEKVWAEYRENGGCT
ncbi:MAG: FAD-binding protein [Oscillospiraceae bacterium]|nr:FAD-binding protein [Oscillospiraceae bacterium]